MGVDKRAKGAPALIWSFSGPFSLSSSSTPTHDLIIINAAVILIVFLVICRHCCCWCFIICFCYHHKSSLSAFCQFICLLDRIFTPFCGFPGPFASSFISFDSFFLLHWPAKRRKERKRRRAVFGLVRMIFGHLATFRSIRVSFVLHSVGGYTSSHFSWSFRSKTVPINCESLLDSILVSWRKEFIPSDLKEVGLLQATIVIRLFDQWPCYSLTDIDFGFWASILGHTWICGQKCFFASGDNCWSSIEKDHTLNDHRFFFMLDRRFFSSESVDQSIGRTVDRSVARSVGPSVDRQHLLGLKKREKSLIDCLSKLLPKHTAISPNQDLLALPDWPDFPTYILIMSLHSCLRFFFYLSIAWVHQIQLVEELIVRLIQSTRLSFSSDIFTLILSLTPVLLIFGDIKDEFNSLKLNRLRSSFRSFRPHKHPAFVSTTESWSTEFSFASLAVIHSFCPPLLQPLLLASVAAASLFHTDYLHFWPLTHLIRSVKTMTTGSLGCEKQSSSLSFVHLRLNLDLATAACLELTSLPPALWLSWLPLPSAWPVKQFGDFCLLLTVGIHFKCFLYRANQSISWFDRLAAAAFLLTNPNACFCFNFRLLVDSFCNVLFCSSRCVSFSNRWSRLFLGPSAPFDLVLKPRHSSFSFSFFGGHYELDWVNKRICDHHKWF